MKSELDFREVGSRIQGFRLKNGLTQDELGEKIGTDQKYISRIEYDKNNKNNKNGCDIISVLHFDSLDGQLQECRHGHGIQQYPGGIRQEYQCAFLHVPIRRYRALSADRFRIHDRTYK